MTLSAQDYHRQTSYSRFHIDAHAMDWANQPSVYKDYPNAETISLPHETQAIDMMLSQICAQDRIMSENISLSADTLSRIFLNSYRITGKTRYQGQDFFYRSVPSAGALYPYEIYAAVCSVREVEDGLYHYDIRNHELRRLRKGNFFTDSEGSAITLFITAIFFRSSWKYRERAYRYHLLDVGHLTESLGLTLKACSIPFEVSYDFADSEINAFLGLDEHREVCLAMIRIPGNQRISIRGIDQLPEQFVRASRVSAGEVSYPMTEQIHDSGSVMMASEKPDEMLNHIGISPSSWITIPKPAHSPEIMNYSEAVARRRSLRNYVRSEMPKDHLDFLLNLICCDSNELQRQTLCMTLITDRIEGLTSGYYLLNQAAGSVALVREGSLTELMAHICLDQKWLANTSLNVCFTTNLNRLDMLWGARGYRYAMISAGRLAQRLYLGATAVGVGSCGIGAFYDNEASEIAELNDTSAMLYLMAIGSVKRMRN